MWLLIDIGNTRIKSAYWSAGILEAGPVFPSHAPHTFDGWANLRQAPARVLVSNVAGAEIAGSLARAVLALWGVNAEFVTPCARLGDFSTRYREPARLGVDRWLAALAAWRDCAGACCVLDMGTALTADIVTADGVHLGGLIAPGLELMRTALTRGTAQLQSERIEAVPGFADNTADAISLGCWSAVSGLLDEVRARLATTAGCGNARWYLTGGGAPALTRMVDWPCHDDPWLVLRGLVVVGESAP
ncbi:MAG: type III pantothenate kinase [Gammaproteobacteria bacterium]